MSHKLVIIIRNRYTGITRRAKLGFFLKEFMGARNSRRMIMMIDEDDDSVSRIEDTSEDSDSIESDLDAHEQSFVDMLHNLISRYTNIVSAIAFILNKNNWVLWLF